MSLQRKTKPLYERKLNAKGNRPSVYKNKTYKNNKYAKRVDETVNWLLDVTRFDDILFDYNCIYGL